MKEFSKLKNEKYRQYALNSLGVILLYYSKVRFLILYYKIELNKIL